MVLREMGGPCGWVVNVEGEWGFQGERSRKGEIKFHQARAKNSYHWSLGAVEVVLVHGGLASTSAFRWLYWGHRSSQEELPLPEAQGY